MKFSIPRKDCSFCTSDKGNLCYALDLIQVRLHTLCTEYHGIEFNLRVINLVFVVVKYKAVLSMATCIKLRRLLSWSHSE